MGGLIFEYLVSSINYIPKFYLIIQIFQYLKHQQLSNLLININNHELNEKILKSSELNVKHFLFFF